MNDLDHEGDKQDYQHFRGIRQIKITSFRPPAVGIICQKEGLLLVATDPNIIEQQCSVTASGIMNILLGVPFYIYIANMSAKSVLLPKHMMVASATNVATCTVHVQSDRSGTRAEGRLDNTAQADNRRVDKNEMKAQMGTGRSRPLQLQSIESVVNCVH